MNSAAVASLIRLSGLYEISPDGNDITCKSPHTHLQPSTRVRQKLTTSSDSIAEPLVWSVLECTISIVCISIPPMRPLFAKAAPSVFSNLADDHDKIKNRISKHFGPIAAAARHPRKSMMLALPRTTTTTANSNSNSPMGGSGANSAFSSQRQLQLIPSFEKVDTPLGSTETVVISLREMEEGGGDFGYGEDVNDADEEASIQGRDGDTTRRTIA